MSLRAISISVFVVFCVSAILPAPLSARQVARRNDPPTIRIVAPTPAFRASSDSITVSGRGVSGVRLRVYRVEPVALLRALRHPYGADQKDFLGLHPQGDAEQLSSDLRALVAGQRPLIETPVPSVPDATGAFTRSVPIPVKNVGAYVLTADGDDGATRSAGLYFLADLKVTRKATPGKRGGLTYEVTDTRTGRPQRGVRIHTRDAYASRWGFQLDPDRGELPQPQPLDSLPAPEFRYVDASGVTDVRGRWHTPAAPFVGRGERVSLEAGTPMATGGMRYDYSQTIAISGTHLGIVAGDFWGANLAKR